MTAAPSTPILVVDDQRDAVRILRLQLADMGFHEVEMATNGVAAMAALREGDFRIVICDWNMAPMTGLDLLHAIRADERLSKIYFIMATGDAEAERVREALASGVDDLIVKPFTGGVLRRKLARFVDPEVP